MEDLKKQEELQTRKEFFKSAAKKVLPFIAAITLTSNPLCAIAEEDESKQCNFGCSGGCSGGCGRSCSYGCSGSCSGTCSGACKGACSRACSYGCNSGSYM